MNVACYSNLDCQRENPSWVCENNCCCSQPQSVNPGLPIYPQPFFDSSAPGNINVHQILFLMCLSISLTIVNFS